MPDTPRRWVAHADMDAFFASVEQLTRPTLKGRPVLVGGVSGRGVVAGCSYEAREYGAHSAMPTWQAVRLCRGKAVLVTPRFSVYKAASRRVFSILRRMAGIVEPLSIDEGFLEVDANKVTDPAAAEHWAADLQNTIESETGLAVSIGVASTKMDAKMASDLAKPHGIRVVPAEIRREVFGSRSVGELWGIGRVAQLKLSDIGVTTIGEFIDLDPYDVRLTLGSVGLEIQRMAGGDDQRPVAPRGEAKQISAERTLVADVTTSDEARRILAATARSAHRRLLADGRVARAITVKTRTTDFSLHTRSATLRVGTDDVEDIIRVALRLLPRPDTTSPVRLIGVGLSGLSHDRQEQLFPELTQAQIVQIHSDDAAAGDSGELDHAVTTSDNDFDGDAASLTPDLLTIPEARPAHSVLARGVWQPTQDVYHPDYGHGWVQGTGLGKVTVRFETRATGPGKSKNFAVDDPDLCPADPIDSLAWEELPPEVEGESGQ